MSTSTNTEIIQLAYERFGSGDIPGLLVLCAENIGWEVPQIENAPFSGTREGTKAVGEFFAQLTDAEDITRFEPFEVVSQKDKVIVLGESPATVKATGRGEWTH